VAVGDVPDDPQGFASALFIPDLDFQAAHDLLGEKGGHVVKIVDLDGRATASKVAPQARRFGLKLAKTASSSRFIATFGGHAFEGLIFITTKNYSRPSRICSMTSFTLTLSYLLVTRTLRPIFLRKDGTRGGEPLPDPALALV
jgi:hypothetical protein